MFGFIGKSIKKMFGTKHDRDVAGYSGVIDRVHEVTEELKGLSNDELRNKTLEFRKRIAEYLAEIDAEIEQLRQ